MGLILTPPGVAGRTQTLRQNGVGAATAVECPLNSSLDPHPEILPMRVETEEANPCLGWAEPMAQLRCLSFTPKLPYTEPRMDIPALLASLDQEIARLQSARKLLSDDPAPKRGPGRPKKSGKSSVKPAGKSTLSAAGRASIAAAQKARWAARKKAK